MNIGHLSLDAKNMKKTTKNNKSFGQQQYSLFLPTPSATQISAQFFEGISASELASRTPEFSSELSIFQSSVKLKPRLPSLAQGLAFLYKWEVASHNLMTLKMSRQQKQGSAMNTDSTYLATGPTAATGSVTVD